MARKALLVGINRYKDPGNDLSGCVNDVLLMARMLREEYGFARKDVKLLTDGEATGDNIRRELSRLTAGASPGDGLVFHYSGHGTQVPDASGDEEDGLDEVICPHDFDWRRPFTDDELGAILGGVPEGALLTVILDCCHSGTGLREFRASPQARSGEDRSRPRCLCPPGLPLRRSAASAPRSRRFGRRAVEAGALLIAACRDDQVAADAFIDGNYHGALTYHLCRALADAAFATTYRDLIVSLRRHLQEAGFEQDPQLEAPTGMDRAAVFTPLVVAA